VATALIFAPPVFLLGMVNPFAIRLATTDIELSGTLAGRIYTVSTVGSLIGTFLPVLITIPLLGTLRTVYLFAVLLLVTAIPSIRGQ
jgi:predicted membrane-bound spermidine synthase